MRVKVPSDIDMPDRIVGRFTMRQILVLLVAAVLIALTWTLIGRHLPMFVFAFLATPLAAAALLWATTPIEGTSAERLAFAALRHLAIPHRRVLSPEGLGSMPTWWPPRSSLGSFAVPIRELNEHATLDLGAEGHVSICKATSLNLALRAEVEQDALVDGFARLLNSLDSPVQFQIHTGSADLGAAAESIEAKARTLSHPSLADAALAHAKFLRDLGARADTLQREVFIAFRTPERDGTVAKALLSRRIEEATTLLRGIGIKLVCLQRRETAELMSQMFACDSETTPELGFDTAVVVGR